ncbi:MAG: alpha/beta hydrolase [Pirellulaceae bacterium]|nr:alpha/beta hydrolase [Pirellulaceae bacterium]
MNLAPRSVSRPRPFRAVLCGVVCCLTACAADAQDKDRVQRAAGGNLVKNWLRRQDKDGDQKIAKAEATGLMKANFARNDKDDNGFLDQQELLDLAKRLARVGDRTNTPNRRRGITDAQLLARVPEGVVVEPNIAYRPGDSKSWRLDLARPKERGDQPRPAVVFIHGGGWRNGDKRTGYFLQGSLDYASQGYVCITINYRLVDEAPFPACLEDCKCAVRWLRAHAEKYNIDPDRIGGYGNSAGAHLVSLLGLVEKSAGLEGDGPHRDQSSLLQAVCCSAPPTDFTLWPLLSRFGRQGGLLAGPEETLEKRAERASPVSYARADAPPFLVVHGTTDSTVPIAHGDQFVKALRDAGAKDVTYLRIDRAGHGVFNQHAKKTHAAMKSFFARTIGEQAK